VEWATGPEHSGDHRTDLSGGSCHTRHAGEKIEKSEGTALKILDQSTRLVEATYLTPFCDQAPIEPLNGNGTGSKNRVDVWHPAAITAQAFLTAAEEQE